VAPARVRAQQATPAPQEKVTPATPERRESPEKLVERLRQQERALSRQQERLAEAERQTELLRQQKAELEDRRNQASEAANEAARAASDQAFQLQQQIEITRRTEALKGEIAAMSEQLTPNHPSLKRAQAELAALVAFQLRASRAPADPAAVREFLQFEIERLNAELQAKRKELEALNGVQK